MAEPKGGNHSNLKSKAVYYLSDLHSTQSIKGLNYYNLAKTYQVTFCTYTVFPKRVNFVNDFTLKNDEGEALNDDMTVVFVELSKLGKILSKPVEHMTTLEMWSIFLQYADKPDQKELVKQIAEAKGEIKMALQTLIHVSQDERERAEGRSRRMYQTDLESNLNTARKNGLIEGRAEGLIEGSAKGRVEGRAEGRAEGRIEGRAEGASQLAELIKQGYDLDTALEMLNKNI